VVDSKNHAFQCAESDDKRFTIPFEQGKKLECLSPYDTEDFLKACKKGYVIEVKLCKFYVGEEFICKDVDGSSSSITSEEAENYFCLTAQHRKRVIERCKNQSF
jgi:hypothetical protein